MFRTVNADVGSAFVTVIVSLVFAAFAANAFVIVVEKFASFPSAVASSFNVSNAAGDESTIAAIAAATNAVVAICVVFVPAVAVGAVGVPVNAGDAKSALASNLPCPVLLRLLRSVFAFPSSFAVI